MSSPSLPKMSHATLLFSFFKFLFLITTQLLLFQLKTLPLFILGSMIYKTIIIHPTFPLHFLLFFPPSSFLSQITVTLLPALPLPFWLFFSPLFHTLPLQFQPFLSIFYSSSPYIFFYQFSMTSSTPMGGLWFMATITRLPGWACKNGSNA